MSASLKFGTTLINFKKGKLNSKSHASNTILVGPSVTRLYYFSIFGHLEQRNDPQKYKIFSKVGSHFCQIHYSTSRNGEKY